MSEIYLNPILTVTQVFTQKCNDLHYVGSWGGGGGGVLCFVPIRKSPLCDCNPHSPLYPYTNASSTSKFQLATSILSVNYVTVYSGWQLWKNNFAKTGSERTEVSLRHKPPCLTVDPLESNQQVCSVISSVIIFRASIQADGQIMKRWMGRNAPFPTWCLFSKLSPGST